MSNPSDRRSCINCAVQWLFCAFALVICGYSLVKQQRLEQRLQVLEGRHSKLETLINFQKPKEEFLKRETRDVTDCACPSGLLLQKKWKSIRGCFTRELRRQDSIMSGNNLGARKSEYTYFQQVQFLLKVVKSRDPSEESLDYIYYGVPEISIKKEDSDTDDPLREEVREEVREDVREDSHKPKRVRYLRSLESDEDRMFLLSMVSALQSVPRDKKLSTKIKLMSVLDDATKGVEENR